MESNTAHDWHRKTATTPTGKTRIVRQCSRCGLVTYSVGRLTAWRYPDGRYHETQTIDEPTCHPTTPEEETMTEPATFDRNAAYRAIVDYSKPAPGAILVVSTIDTTNRMATTIWRMGDEIWTVLVWTTSNGTPVGSESFAGQVVQTPDSIFQSQA